MTSSSDTIYALASGTGRVAVCVLRVSGSQAFPALECLQGRLQAHALLVPRLLKDPACGETLDRAMTVRFCAPKSYTGEDMAEIHCHGSRAVVDAVLAAWRNDPKLSLRQAERGEFTRRALVAGKLSLTQAEGLLDLVAAETQAQRRQALVQSEGALADIYSAWEERIFRLLAQSEAYIDFADEDLPSSSQRVALQSLVCDIEERLAQAEKAVRVRCGVCVAIVGAPNVGKSSLLNRIADSEVAIVADTPGTTRDVLRVRCEIATLSVDLLDTAGLRKAQDAVEAEGIRRTKENALKADIVVRVEVASQQGGKSVADGSTVEQEEFEQEEIEQEEFEQEEIGREIDLRLFNKSDLLDDKSKHAFSLSANAFLVSAHTGEGIAVFMEGLAKMLEQRLLDASSPLSSSLAPARARHIEALERVIAELRQALKQESARQSDWGLQAEHLREAHRAIARLVGKRDTEALLDQIFADFCIGK